jgi:hypothetical protein
MARSGINFRATFGIVVALLGLIGAAPAWAQVPNPPSLAPGCTCPAGSTILAGNQCAVPGIGTVPATCPTAPVPPTPVSGPFLGNIGALNQSVGHLAASQQQLSFWGVRSILEQRRDQLQGTLGAHQPMSMMSGYADSALDEETDALGYAQPSKRSNPLAYKAPPAPVNTGPNFALWTQGLADYEHDSPTSSFDLSHVARIYSGQAGVDGTWRNVAGGALVVGLVGSWTGAHVSYDGTPTTTKLEGPGVGLYSTYVNGSFSADSTVKFDFLHLTEDFAGLAPANTTLLTNGGVSGNLQDKLQLKGGSFIEPTAGFAYTRAMFGADAITFGLTDASTLRLQAGARFGATLDVNGVSVEPSLKALVYSNVIAEGSSTAAGIAGIVPTDQGKIRGEIDPDVNWDFGNGCLATLAATVRFGEGMLGGSASLNLRKQF